MKTTRSRKKPARRRSRGAPPKTLVLDFTSIAPQAKLPPEWDAAASDVIAAAASSYLRRGFDHAAFGGSGAIEIPYESLVPRVYRAADLAQKIFADQGCVCEEDDPPPCECRQELLIIAAVEQSTQGRYVPPVEYRHLLDANMGILDDYLDDRN
jgi:hypothetical protein